MRTPCERASSVRLGQSARDGLSARHAARRWLLWVALTSMLAAGEMGPPIGAAMPDAASVVKPRGALLVFFPSNAGLEQLAANRDDLAKFNVGVAVVTKAADGITEPGIVALDGSGHVKAKYFGKHETAGAVAVHEFGWTPSAARAERSGRQIKLASAASDAVVFPGDRLALVLDIDLRPRLHVYAPGAEGYIPISWTLKDSPGYRVLPVEMPPAQTLYLAAIDEKAPVYEGHLRLVRDVTIAQPSGDLNIEGALKYQACDDRMCYIPDTVLLQWTLRSEGPVSTRIAPELQRK